MGSLPYGFEWKRLPNIYGCGSRALRPRTQGSTLPRRDPFVLQNVPQPNSRRDVLPRRAQLNLAWAVLTLATVAGGCRFAPSNDRDWAPEVSRLATADIEGESVVVHNVRNCTYRTQSDYDVHYEDRRYDLGKLDVVDYILVPFSDMPRVAHTFLSFGFHDEDYVSISIESRRLHGEVYTPVRDFVNQSEIVYVVGDERDLIRLRSNFRKDDVYLYRVNVTPEQCRTVFVDMLQRCNRLAAQPEFYNTLTNNCATNLVVHFNKALPQKIPYTYQVLFPGLSDQLIYNMGLIKNSGTFEQTREAARINRLAYIYRDSPEFSQAIRRY
jgi:Domain of unknown function (DUF4105)